jgi:hypothetical protein
VIATGPADETGLGAAFRQRSDLEAILQDLGAFPGGGRALVEAGLRCRTVRNRNMALKVLREWGRSGWPGTADAALRRRPASSRATTYARGSPSFWRRDPASPRGPRTRRRASNVYKHLRHRPARAGR